MKNIRLNETLVVSHDFHDPQRGLFHDSEGEPTPSGIEIPLTLIFYSLTSQLLGSAWFVMKKGVI